MCLILSRSSEGMMRQRINCRFRSTAWSASLRFRIIGQTGKEAKIARATGCRPGRVHERSEIRHARPELAALVLLPADRRRSHRRVSRRQLVRRPQAQSGRPSSAFSHKDHAQLCGGRGQLGEAGEVKEEVAQRPAGR